MTSNAIVPENNLRTHESYEQITPVRGCKVSLDNIKEVYSELSRINFEHGQREIANLVKSPDTTDEQWEAHTQNLLENAFRLAISITGEGDQRVYSFDIEIFSSDNLPRQIERIYLDNIVAYKPYANQLEPANKISVMLDFDKPTLLDPHLVVSAATPNESKVHINGTDISFFRAAQQVIDSKLTNRGTWYGIIHKNFAYDLGLWLVALPFALFFFVLLYGQIFPRRWRSRLI